MNCPNCGTQVPEDADYCPGCGRDLRPRGSFPWVPTLLAFIAGAALCAVIGLVAGVGKTTTDTVIAHHGGGHPPSTATATVSATKTNTKTKTKRVTVSGPTHTVKAQPATKTVHVTSTATVSTTATSTTTVSTTKTVTSGG
jgi:zinc-ribbon domain